MIVGVLQLELTIPHSQSLKDKRRVVKSLKDRLHREHMVSVAETGAIDDLRTAVLTVALASTSAPFASEVFDRILEKVRAVAEARLGSVSRRMIHESELEWRGEADGSDDAAWSQSEAAMAADAERLLRGGES